MSNTTTTINDDPATAIKRKRIARIELERHWQDVANRVQRHQAEIKAAGGCDRCGNIRCMCQA